jgi:transposase
VFFDEFAVYDRPSLFYAWAEKNSRPEIPSNERKRNKVNGLLCVDAVSGEEYLSLKPKAKTEDVASYLAALCSDCVNLGITKLSIILDNNSTHKQKMRTQLRTRLSELDIQEKIEVEFIDTPPYSPDFNLAEYIIHLLRLYVLHHQRVEINIQQVGENLQNFLQNSQVQTPEQIQKTIAHICSLAE